MSNWDERSQSVRDVLNAFAGRLTELEQLATDQTGLAVVQGLKVIAREVERRLANSNPSMVSTTMLRTLESSLGGLRDRIAGELNTAAQKLPIEWAHIDSTETLDAIARWPDLPTRRAPSAAVWAAVEAIPDELAARFGRLDKQVHDMTVEWDASLASVMGAAAEWRQTLDNRSVELENRITSQVELITQQTVRLEQALTSNAEQFAGEQDRRRAEFEKGVDKNQASFTAAQQERADEFESAHSAFKTTSQELIDGLKQQGESSLSELNRRLDEAKEIVGVIARTGMTAGYQQQANGEKADAERWRKMTVGFAITAALVLAAAVLATAFQHPGGVDIAGRFTLAAAFGGIATYMGRQAAGHRQRADHARNLELALASIGPYLEALDPDKREEILTTFAYIFFTPRKVLQEDPEIGSVQNLLSLFGGVGKPSGPS